MYPPKLPSNRASTLLATFERFREFEDPRAIVEFGSIRSLSNIEGDGHSTTFLALLAQDCDATFYSVDSDHKATAIAMRVFDIVVRNYTRVHACHCDAKAWVLAQAWEQPPNSWDLVYLDGPDDPAWTLEMLEAALPYMSDRALLLFDDTHWESHPITPDLVGKGSLAIPRALENGFRVIACNSQQVLLQRRPSSQSA